MVYRRFPQKQMHQYDGCLVTHHDHKIIQAIALSHFKTSFPASGWKCKSKAALPQVLRRSLA
ncbi:MAG: hypothetical protein V7K27_24685 [Nostoc sp.]|uniref:hypothetical protein n=1 Tax=Nostoc sp. TaxID=1180 RepID=UPI002FF8EF1E